MCHLLETIRIDQNGARNMLFHNQRMNETRKALFNISKPLHLEEILVVPSISDRRIVKCRVFYNEVVNKIEYINYQKSEIKTLQVVYADVIEYGYKFADRNELNLLHSQKGNCDDVLIIKNGFVTDTTFCNIVFYDGNRWVTSDRPLLPGTMRQHLIKQNIIEEIPISIKNIHNYQKFKLINALFLFEDEAHPIENIKF